MDIENRTSNNHRLSAGQADDILPNNSGSGRHRGWSIFKYLAKKFGRRGQIPDASCFSQREPKRKKSRFTASKTVAFLAVTVVACVPASQLSRVNFGVGNDLFSTDLDGATANLNTYLAYICRQAGLNDGATNATGQPSCRISGSNWSLMVRTGFNDIDRRCDGYLSWLQAVRSRDAFINSQFTQVARLTNQILTAVNPAAGTTIGIVAEAFGYAKSTFNDYQQRILLGYEDSTIQTIVSERRLNFREKLADVRIGNRPDAIFVLRSYLRICMPFTIAMDANTYARATATGTGDNLVSAKEAEMVRNSVLGRALLRSIPETPDEPVKPDAPGEFTLKGIGLTRLEKTLSEPEATTIQRALCISTKIPYFGEVTRNAIRNAKIGLSTTLDDYGTVFPEDRASANFNKFNIDKQIDFFTTGDGNDDCLKSDSQYKNSYEKFRFPKPQSIKNFQNTLIACELNLGRQTDINFEATVTESGIFDRQTRTAIGFVITKFIEKGLYTGSANTNEVFPILTSPLSKCRTL